jgi:hypothetical protein
MMQFIWIGLNKCLNSAFDDGGKPDQHPGFPNREPVNRIFYSNLFIVNYVLLTCSTQLIFFPLEVSSSIFNRNNTLSDEVQVECFVSVYLPSVFFPIANMSG